jgi:hypothetical protein
MFHPFYPLHFLPLFVSYTEFKGSTENAPSNVFYDTPLRNYASISLPVPSNLSILLRNTGAENTVQYAASVSEEKLNMFYIAERNSRQLFCR